MPIVNHNSLRDRVDSAAFTAVEAAGEGVVVTDSYGVIQYVNPAFQNVTGYSAEEAVGRDLHILDSGQQDDNFYRALKESLNKDGVWRGRMISKKKDGTPYHEDCTISTVKNETGEVINYVALKRDVTDQLRLESMSEAVNIADNIGYVFSGIRHEIGNPVNAIRMTLSMLRSKLEGNNNRSAVDFIRRCLDELSRIQYLLDSLKNFNMFENPNVQVMNTAEFMKKFRSLIMGDLEKQGISLHIDIDPNADTCLADARALQQVLLNIVTNAIEACRDRKKPKIAVLFSGETDRICIQVIDNGRGMTHEQKQKLFRPFYTSKKSGTGLGLVITRRMLSKMNGSIEVASEQEVGTTVTIHVPYRNNDFQVGQNEQPKMHH
jgi:PAS domain S-box-containing protein